MSHRGLVQSLDRGLEILELVSAGDDGVPLSDLARHLDVTPSTAFALAKTLVNRGYVEKTRRPVRYRLGPGVLRLGALRERRELIKRASVIVREVFTRLGTATVLLAEPVGGEVIASLRMDPSRPAMLERAPNWPLPPYSTALGLCFQAFWPAPERTAYRRRHPFEEYGRMHWDSVEQLDAFLAETRSRGAVVVADKCPVRAAAPVYGSGGHVVAGLGASLSHEPTPAPDKAQLVVEAVVSSAAALSADLATAPEQKSV